MEDECREIVSIMMRKGIKQKDVAEFCGISEQTFSYQLYHAKKFDVKLRECIYKYFFINGITTNQTGEADMISNHFLEHTQVVNHHLAVIAKTVKDAVADKKIDTNERKQLLNRISDFREECADTLNKLEGLLQ